MSVPTFKSMGGGAYSRTHDSYNDGFVTAQVLMPLAAAAAAPADPSVNPTTAYNIDTSGGNTIIGNE